MLDIESAVADLRRTHPADVADVLERVGSVIGHDITLYLVDFGQTVLQPLPHLERPRVVVEENVATSLAGRAFTTGDVVTARRATGVRVWVPVHEQSARTGVLALTVPELSARISGQCQQLGDLAGMLCANAARFTDLFHVRRRGRSMSLAASMQWDLLPPLTMRSPHVVVTGVLEPAYEVAGDAFDYALNDTHLDVAMFDGMGHGIASTLLTTLTVGAYRHARRAGADLASTFAEIDAVLDAQYDGDAFATGLLARLEVTTGLVHWLSAGHPPPLLLRGRRAMEPLTCEPTLPLGLEGASPELQTTALEPGDAMLLYTDGVIEARTPEGAELGLHRLADLLEREAAAQTSPEETLRRLIRSTLDHHGGTLRDDATLLMVVWAGPSAATMVPPQATA